VSNNALAGIVGSSGSGKSSLIFAGLLPHLHALNNWVIIQLRPQNLPIYELAKSLSRLIYEDTLQQANKVNELLEHLETGQVVLPQLADLVLEAKNKRLLIIIDQFEELYTHNHETKIQELFLNTLLTVLQQGHSVPVSVLFTLRADFMGHALSYAPFANALDKCSIKLLGSIEKETALKAVITEPAAKSEVVFEPLLVDRILRDLGQQSVHNGDSLEVNLPLLEFTLSELWEHQTDHSITHLSYEELGSVQNALSRYADTILKKFSEVEQKQLRQVMVQLIRPGEGTEDTRQVSTKAQVGEENWNIITRLADLRLVTTGFDEQTEEETVEVVHEALIRTWQPLRDWMVEDRSFRVWQNSLRSLLNEWKKAETNKKENYLLSGAKLSQAEDQLSERSENIPNDEQTFIEQSQKFRDHELEYKEKLRRRVFLSLGFGFAIAVMMGIFLFMQVQETQKQAKALKMTNLSLKKTTKLANSARLEAE